MFNPTSLDDASVQETHLEARGKNVTHDVGKSSKHIESKNKGRKIIHYLTLECTGYQIWSMQR